MQALLMARSTEYFHARVSIRAEQERQFWYKDCARIENARELAKVV